MSKLFVIDASGYIYRSYFAIRNITNAKGESTNALFGFVRSILKLYKDFNPEYVVCVFDGPNNIKKRVELYPEYKGHRNEMPYDLKYQIEWAKEYCELAGLPHLCIPEVEADDTMGSVSKWAKEQGFTTYLCTSDKDMCQLVNGSVFILNTFKENQILGAKEIEEIYGVPPGLIIDLLAIIGDASDNVPGVSGFGPKTASALLRQYGSLDKIIENVDQIPGKKRETFIKEKENALISRLLVTVDTEVPCPHNPDFYRLKKTDLSKLKEFYSSMSFNSLIKELEQGEKNLEHAPTEAPVDETHEYSLVNDEPALDAMIEALLKEPEIAFAIQTAGNLPQKAELAGIAFSVAEKKAYYVPFNGGIAKEAFLQKLKGLFENANISFYGHNIKFQLQVLEKYGIHAENFSFDIVLASYILNSHSRQHSLDTLILENFGRLKVTLDDILGKGKKAVSILDIAPEKLLEHAGEEADYTIRMKQILQRQLDSRNLSKILFDIELPLTKVLAKMETKGIFIDLNCLKVLSQSLQGQIRALEQGIYDMAGEQFNINSPKQLSGILFDKLGIKAPKKTATGLSTNAEVLESLKDRYPIAGKLIDYRLLEKLRSTYVDALPLQTSPEGRIHCTFNQSVAATGRLSSQDPNLQNIPIRSEVGRSIREAFRPEKPDWSFLSADYSQIELRLLAHFSEDPTLMHAFQNNEDIHVHTAAAMYGIPIEQVTPEQRQSAKAVNFGVVYGQQAYGLSVELGIDFKQAAAFIDMYFKRYSRVKEYLESSKEFARKTGKAVTFTGRERAIPEIHNRNPQIRSLAERLAINTPLQGTAADIIKMAMLEIDRKIEEARLQGFMILQIHDELIFEIPDSEIGQFKVIVEDTMQNIVKLNVPLIVNIAIGKNWKEC